MTKSNVPAPEPSKVWMVLSIVFVGAVVAMMLTRVTPDATFTSEFGAGNTPKKAAAAADPELHTYKVQPGDTWWRIAHDHSVSTRALLDRNGADISTPLAAGQNVILPDEPAQASPGRAAPSASSAARGFGK